MYTVLLKKCAKPTTLRTPPNKYQKSNKVPSVGKYFSIFRLEDVEKHCSYNFLRQTIPASHGCCLLHIRNILI